MRVAAAPRAAWAVPCGPVERGQCEPILVSFSRYYKAVSGGFQRSFREGKNRPARGCAKGGGTAGQSLAEVVVAGRPASGPRQLLSELRLVSETVAGGDPLRPRHADVRVLK